MKVLFLTMWYPNQQNPVSGTFVHEQVEALRTQGVEVRVMQPLPLTPVPINWMKQSYRELDAVPEKEIFEGHPVYHPRYLTLPGHRLFERVGEWMFKGIRAQMRDIYREWPFAILHAHATYPCGFAANRCRDVLFPAVKVLHTIHRTCIIDAPNYNKACFEKVRVGLEGADFNVFVSGEGLRLGLEYTNQSTAGKSKYITNGVNTEKFALNQAECGEVAALKIAYSETWNLVFVGYLKEVKGIKELLEAIKNLVRRGRSNLRLFLVGDNQLGNFVSGYLAAHGLEDSVIVIGAVPHQKVKIWMRFASAFILPSHSEGTPTVLFEALFVGAPSIFTAVGGVGDVVRDRQEALLIPPRSVMAIEEAIKTLMDDPALCEQLASRGHELIKNQFTWDINACAMLQRYERLLSNSASEKIEGEPA